VATIRKRGTRWQAQVRLQVHAPNTKSFKLRADAELWGRQQEVAIERGDVQSSRGMLKAHTLRDLLERYETEVSSKKRGAVSEHYRLRTLKASEIARLRLDMLTTARLQHT
jgi:hypothetical protein